MPLNELLRFFKIRKFKKIIRCTFNTFGKMNIPEFGNLKNKWKIQKKRPYSKLDSPK